MIAALGAGVAQTDEKFEGLQDGQFGSLTGASVPQAAGIWMLNWCA